jgi:hypothetical protein
MIQAADLISWETERGHAGFASFLSAVSEIVGPATHQEEKEKGAQISESHLEPQSAVQPEELVTPQPPAVQTEPAAVKPAEPQPEAAAPTETSPSAPRKKRYALKFGLVAGVVVLLIVGIWWYISEAQKEKIRIEIKSEIDRIAGQITDLEQNVAKIDKQEQLKDLYEQKDFLKKQADVLSESAVEAGFGERMKQISDRLQQVQIQLANKERELIAARKGRIFVETVPEDAQVRILNIKPKFFQEMALEPGSYHVEVSAEGYERQRRWVELVSGREEPFRFELSKLKVAEPQGTQ